MALEWAPAAGCGSINSAVIAGPTLVGLAELTEAVSSWSKIRLPEMATPPGAATAGQDIRT